MRVAETLTTLGTTRSATSATEAIGPVISGSLARASVVVASYRALPVSCGALCCSGSPGRVHPMTSALSVAANRTEVRRRESGRRKAG